MVQRQTCHPICIVVILGRCHANRCRISHDVVLVRDRSLTAPSAELYEDCSLRIRYGSQLALQERCKAAVMGGNHQLPHLTHALKEIDQSEEIQII